MSCKWNNYQKAATCKYNLSLILRHATKPRTIAGMMQSCNWLQRSKLFERWQMPRRYADNRRIRSAANEDEKRRSTVRQVSLALSMELPGWMVYRITRVQTSFQGEYSSDYEEEIYARGECEANRQQQKKDQNTSMHLKPAHFREKFWWNDGRLSWAEFFYEHVELKWNFCLPPVQNALCFFWIRSK